jgi:ankyrin repeat protein
MGVVIYNKCGIKKELCMQIILKESEKANLITEIQSTQQHPGACAEPLKNVPARQSKAPFRKFKAENNLQLQAMPDELLYLYIKYGNNSDGIPALLYAVKKGDLDAAKLFIQHGADPLTRDNEKNTALYYALLSKNSQLVALFLQMGFDPNVTNRSGLPIWYDAIKLDDQESFELLIKAGLNICPEDGYDVLNNNPALVCIQNGSLNILKLIIRDGGFLPRNSIVLGEQDPVLWSISSNGWPGREKEKIECLKWLINIGVLDLKNAKAINISNTFPEFLGYVIDNGFLGVNQKLLYDNYPIHLVLHNPSLVRVLVSRGADVNIKCGDNGYGRSPLHNASNLETVKILISNGADVNAIDKLGRTPLFYANDPKIKRLLIEHGAILKG